MPNKFVTEEYAKEIQADLEAAVKVKPDMFNLGIVADFGKKLVDADCNLLGFIRKLDQVFKEEVRFTEDERNTIKRIVNEAGFKVTKEASKDSITKEEWGDKYNPVRDDYVIALDNGIGIHFLKKRVAQGGYLVDAQKGIKLEYNILGFFTADAAKNVFNNPELDILLYKRADNTDFSFDSNMENLRKAFTIDFAKIVDGDAYWDAIEKFDEERRKARDKARKQNKDN